MSPLKASKMKTSKEPKLSDKTTDCSIVTHLYTIFLLARDGHKYIKYIMLQI